MGGQSAREGRPPRQWRVVAGRRTCPHVEEVLGVSSVDLVDDIGVHGQDQSFSSARHVGCVAERRCAGSRGGGVRTKPRASLGKRFFQVQWLFMCNEEVGTARVQGVARLDVTSSRRRMLLGGAEPSVVVVGIKRSRFVGWWWTRPWIVEGEGDVM